MNEKELRRETRNDLCLSQVVKRVEDGWDSYKECPDLKPYATRKHEIAIHNGVLMWGSRVIVPNKLRNRVLDTLHEGHLGMVKMKGLGRSYVWWPGFDKDVEELVKSCVGCQQVANSPAPVPLHR